MSLTTAGKNLAIDAINPTQMSLHTGDPSDSGANNEASGGGYSRKSCSFGSPSNGEITLDSTVSFSVAGSSPTTIDYTHYAVWAGATCVDQGALASTKQMTENGTIDITSGSISIS